MKMINVVPYFSTNATLYAQVPSRTIDRQHNTSKWY